MIEEDREILTTDNAAAVKVSVARLPPRVQKNRKVSGIDNAVKIEVTKRVLAAIWNAVAIGIHRT